MGHEVGRILAVLHDEGLAEDPLVVCTAVHGDWLGDPGLVLKESMFYEGLLRVGLILRGPGEPAAWWRGVRRPLASNPLRSGSWL